MHSRALDNTHFLLTTMDSANMQSLYSGIFLLLRPNSFGERILLKSPVQSTELSHCCISKQPWHTPAFSIIHDYYDVDNFLFATQKKKFCTGLNVTLITVDDAVINSQLSQPGI